MSIPDQLPSVQRAIYPGYPRQLGGPDMNSTPGSFFVSRNCVTPSDANQCYAYQGEARNLCFSLYQS